MKLLVKTCCLYLSLYIVPVFAIDYEGNVQGFYINTSNTALVKLGGTGGAPDCIATGVWHLKFDSSKEYAKHWISMILAARMAEKPIRVGYSKNADGSCNVAYFYFYG
ncbi:hypothetical protein HWQ46_26430 [Shewanella sp. D64]|uniref:hypothetical protein n=1 Tax=unclassified Shewanella TaxID=196818 RepID=UPI0022BA3636|nr:MULTISPECIES: hypothetical protein [unclassified Shewanella]MEC4729054.1 hypothetical protein [Shewanella sp. D64]MEC4737887.1 hypothetical protein [Shewanella sp. E94]WBJ93860.1 hypothetical protein HWQ47_18265 [Shewanella sp. MTB7]